MHSPTSKHLNAACHILGYLKGIPGKGLLFRKNDDRGIKGFVDIDWVGSIKEQIYIWVLH